MEQTLSPRTRRRLDSQGFETVDERELAPVAPWLHHRYLHSLDDLSIAVGLAGYA
jgi:hypothetical protein